MNALLQQLQSELLQTLGVYQPGQAPVVYSPVQTRNRWSRATLAHEETHQTLTIHTTYGTLFQMLAGAEEKGTLTDLLPLCLDAQWGTQEGTASYVQMAWIAIDDPAGFDEALSLLPTALLGKNPYREAFDRIERLLPLAPAGDTQEDLLRISDQADFALALGLYAMSPDVLEVFSLPSTLEPKRFAEYLTREGPDVRLTRLIEKLEQDPRTERLLEDFRSLCAAARAGKPADENPVQWLVRSFTLFDVGHATADPVARRSDDARIAEVKYLPDWADRFPEAFAEEALTAEILRAQLAAAQQGRFGLSCSIAMRIEEDLHLTTMPYPRGAGIDPSSWEEIVELLKNPPTTMGVLKTGEVLAAFEAFPHAPLSIDFIRSSWRIWDRVTAGREIFRNAVQTCFEIELTEQGLRELLSFRDLARAAEYVFFRVQGEQCAACFWDPSRPGLYALQGIAGDAGLHVFERLTERLQLRQFPGKLSDLPHSLLILLAGRGFLL